MINRVVLIGRVTKGIEVKKTQTGLSVASFTIAVNRRPSKDSQERQADFINCVAWRATADYLGNYVKKGALLGVEGRIQTRNYDGSDVKKVYVTEVLCDSVQSLESRNASSNRSTDETSQYTPSFGGYEADNSFDDFSSGPSLDISNDDLPF